MSLLIRAACPVTFETVPFSTKSGTKQLAARQGRSLGRGFRGGAPGPWASGGPGLAPVGPPRGNGSPTVAVLAAV
ncbi:unnamed protein product [Gadus morhua 'NCC']